MPETFTPVAVRGADGLAVIGRTLHDLRGIRHDEGEGGAAPAVPAPPAESVAPIPSAAPVTPAGWDGRIESLDPGAQKIITDLRKEAADNRVKANTESARVAAILAAAGIQSDAPDPVEIAKQSTAEAAAAKRELAIFKAAAATGADPTRLLDSNSFMSSVSGLDPADGAAVTAAITAAIAANPQLKAAQAASASGTELGGTGETGQITEAQLAQMTPEEKVTALRAGKLQHLLT